jgi:four helix bundle protein
MDSYRSLDVWKIAHEASVLAYRSCDQAYQGRSRTIFDQFRRAALSVEANIVEGYALGTPALCLRHLRIAFGSAAEAECLIRLTKELQYLPVEICDQLEVLLGRAMQMLRRLMRNPPAAPTHDAPRTTHGLSAHDAPRTTHGLSTHDARRTTHVDG